MILPYATTSDVIVLVEMVFRYLKELKTTHTISEESCIKLISNSSKQKQQLLLCLYFMHRASLTQKALMRMVN